MLLRLIWQAVVEQATPGGTEKHTLRHKGTEKISAAPSAFTTGCGAPGHRLAQRARNVLDAAEPRRYR